MRRRLMRVVSAALLTVAPACSAPDAGTPCYYDYHCISGSCTFGTCDAFPGCWPTCGEQDEDDEEEEAAAPVETMRDAGWLTLDAAACKLRLCAELSLDECRSEPACEVSTRCDDAGVLSRLPAHVLSAGSDAGVCMTPERCTPSWGPDLRIHPLGSCF